MKCERRKQMNQRIEALETTIKHWEKNVKAPTIHELSIGPKACDCCKKWNPYSTNYLTINESKCNGCPIYDFTGISFCEGTPYMDIYDELDRVNFKRYTRNARAFAEKEVAFLKMVLEWEREKADASP